MKKLLILAISIIFVLSLASCDIIDSVFAKGSEGLEYELSEDDKSYTVTGIGNNPQAKYDCCCCCCYRRGEQVILDL